MSDEQIRELLNCYVETEMSFIDPDEYRTSDVNASKKYHKKIKKLLSTEKYFGKYIYTGYALRWVAIVALCVLSLAGVNQVSAKVLGFNPWKYIMSYIQEVKMEKKTYTRKKETSTKEDIQVLAAKREIPNYIPATLVEIQTEKEEDDFVFVMWQGEDEEHIANYGRNKIVKGMVTVSDAEYEQKEKCVVAGYEAYFYQKDKENWIEWSDDKYLYQIFMKNISNPKEELLKMSKSIYQ